MLSALTGLGMAAGGLGGGLLGSLLSYASAQSVNSTSRRIARENRQWMEKMANTAHQREVEDLRAAGLNPILSATGGAGAAVPSVDTSAHQVASDFGDLGIGSAVKGLATAIDLKRADAQLGLAKAQARELSSSAELNDAKMQGELIKNAFEADTYRDRQMMSTIERKRADHLREKAFHEAFQAMDEAWQKRRDVVFENSAYGKALYHAKRTKEAYKNGVIGDVAGTLQSDIFQLLQK